jgi:hypothetical protein
MAAYFDLSAMIGREGDNLSVAACIKAHGIREPLEALLIRVGRLGQMRNEQ